MSRAEHQPLLASPGEEIDESHCLERESINDISENSKASYSSMFMDMFGKSRNKLHHRVGPAAFLIRDAVMDIDAEHPSKGAYNSYYSRNPNGSLRNVASVACRRLCAYQPFVTLLNFAGWAMFFLTFVEPPYWCLGSEDDPERSCASLFRAKGISAGGADSDREDDVEYYPNSHSMLIDEEQSRKIESVCACVVFICILLRIGRDGFSLKRYLRNGPARWNRVVQLVALFLIVVGLGKDRFVYRPYARLAIVMSFNNFGFQRELRDLVEVLPRVFQILALLSLLMLFYGWFGTIMFANTEEGKDSFSNLIESLWTLWMCVTTVNYPDVMMPAYNRNRWVALYFVSFMAIAFFFLMNLILAVIVNQYNENATERSKKRRQYSKDCLKKAFKLLDLHGKGWIDRDTVMALFFILNEDFPEFRHISEEEALIFFAILDKDGSSKITEKKFMDCINVLSLEFVRESDCLTWVELHFPEFYRSAEYQVFCRFVKSARFECAIDFILFLNAIVIAIQSYPELLGTDIVIDPTSFDGSIGAATGEVVGTVFTAFYGLEIFIKITVYGWASYIADQRNVFDFTISILAIFSVMVIYSPVSISFDSRLIRLIVMLRALRMVRVLPGINIFQLIFRKGTKILPYAASILLLLFFVFFLYSSVGVHQYGGLISRDPTNRVSNLLLNNSFSDNNYWANNFNDMVSGMNVLFNLLVVNNWNECEIGFEAVTEGKWVRWFFLSFHLIAVILVNNLVVAFVIEAFLEQLALSKKRGNGEPLRKGAVLLSGVDTAFDATGIKGNEAILSRFYRVRLRSSSNDLSGGKRGDQDLEERLTKLLSQPVSPRTTV